MTSVVSPHPVTRRAMASRLWLTPLAARTLFLAAVLPAAVLGFAVTGRSEAVQAASVSGLDFVHLMHFMVLIKAMMAAAAAIAVLWRLGDGIGSVRLLAYGGAAACMAGGVGLIWDMVHMGAGAVLLHAGLIGTGVMLWRDPATARRLEKAVKGRARPSRLQGH